MSEGETPVYLRGHHAAEGYVAVDPRPIEERDAALIAKRINEFATKSPSPSGRG
jgi:hypothetical protein